MSLFEHIDVQDTYWWSSAQDDLVWTVEWSEWEGDLPVAAHYKVNEFGDLLAVDRTTTYLPTHWEYMELHGEVPESG
jgi:hypothetical protein